MVTVAPGPANLAVSTVAMARGQHAGLNYAFGLGLGLAFWGVVAATGLGAIFETSVTALFALKVLGGLYLIWLGYKSWKSAGHTSSAASMRSHGRSLFLQGLILNLSNPKAILAWLAALSVGLETDGGKADLVLATLVCMAFGFANYSAYAFVFSRQKAMDFYASARNSIDALAAALFTLAGLALLRSAFARTAA